MSAEELDNVLFAFHRAAKPVTPELVAAWTRRYPHYADDIRAHAVEIVDVEFRAGTAAVAVPVSDVSSVGTSATLREAASLAGTTLRDLADGLGIARSVVSDVNSGAIDAATVTTRFVRRVADRLGLPEAWLAAMASSPRAPALGVAFKASGAPGAGRARTWEEAIRDSDMDDERKAFWLEEEA